MWKFLGSIKKEAEFPGVLKENSCGLEFPWVLLFDLGISKVSHNFAEILGVKACFLGIQGIPIRVKSQI